MIFWKKQNKIILHRLILWNVFFNMTHVLPLISAPTYDKNALQNRRGRPVLNQFGSLTIIFVVLSLGQNLPMYSILPHNICKSIKYITVSFGSLIENSLFYCTTLCQIQHTCPESWYEQNYNYGPEFLRLIWPFLWYFSILHYFFVAYMILFC